MRTITAPGVEWREIDKSGYSPAMTGTACYIMGFSDKGEPYKPMEFTSRAAWTSYYGEPDNEAERYFYAAACEVLNQNGRLYCARLPYSNDAFEKMVGIKYTVRSNVDITDNEMSPYIELCSIYDNELSNFAIIEPSKDPITYELTAIDEYRTDEAKVPADTFLIVDTTGGTYAPVIEDYRRGQKREVIGIVPVVTTAANALYAQSMISVELDNLYNYEVLGGSILKTLKTDKYTTDGLLSSDLVNPLNTKGLFKKIDTEIQPSVYIIGDFNEYQTKDEAFNQLCSAISAVNLIPNIDEELKIDNYVDKSFEVDIRNMTLIEISSGVDLPVNIIESIDDLHKSVKILCEYYHETYKLDTIGQIAYAVYELAAKNIDIPNSLIDDYSTIQDVVDIVDELYEASGTKMEWRAQITYKTSVAPYYESSSIPTTQSLDAANFFPTIQPSIDGEGFDPEHLKDIGVVVYKMFLDPAEGNKVNFEAVEAYAGSLYKDDKDPNTGVTKFIDTIINSQSKYINFFSNCFSTPSAKKFYKETCDMLIAKPKEGATLGFYSEMTKEDISLSKSIYDGMNKSFDKVSDINQLNIDIVCDAGLANIGSYLKAVFEDKGPYDLTITDDLGNSMLNFWKCEKATQDLVKTWKIIEQKFDTFCKKTRKDCMFIADGLRPLVLQGNKPIIRDSKPKNTLDVNVIPYLPAICGLNTSYGAGYVDWFEVADDYTGDFFWCPPSIKAMGVYINTDVNFNYWDAPAGLNRGIVSAVNVAFSPTPKQAGCFYEKNWNYSINYPNDGIILEGQKTFQVKPSAFDRVNVRRLFLRLERAAYQVARYFVYEGNTAYTRQRLVDALDPYFKEAKIGGGIYDYKILCDESTNPPEVIDRNELHVKIGIKPVKTAEFIMIDFIALSTGGSFEEAMG